MPPTETMTNAGLTPDQVGQDGQDNSTQADSSACCKDRNGEKEVTGQANRIFNAFGRPKEYVKRSADMPIDSANTDWEKYSLPYYYNLRYSERAIQVTVRLKLKNATGNVPRKLKKLSGMLEAKTDEEIAVVFEKWKQLVDKRWNARYVVDLRDPLCPRQFSLFFNLEKVDKKEHAEIDIIAVKDPSDTSITPFDVEKAKNNGPEDENHEAAVALIEYERSDHRKLNLLDSGEQMPPHEYGHWIGWGDEYIEVSGQKKIKKDPDGKDPSVSGKVTEVEVDYDSLGPREKPIRIAVKVRNPTNHYRAAAGTDEEIINLTSWKTEYGLMANGFGARARYVYVVADDFVRLYNDDNHAGKPVATCGDVLVRE